MILLKFLKQQNWWYLIPCLIFLYLFNCLYINLGWELVFATGFLICYSLKYANKHNNLLIDKLKLGFYFLYFTATLIFINSHESAILVSGSFNFSLFFLYFYTILFFYKSEEEKKGSEIKGFYWIMVLVTQTIFMFGIIIWAITQKVEADKQRELALIAKEDAIKAQIESSKQKELAEISKNETLRCQEFAERQKELTAIAQEKAIKIKEESLKRKK